MELTYHQNIFRKHKIDHIFLNKTRLNRYKKLEITPYIISEICGLNLNFNKIKNKGYKLMETEQLPMELWLVKAEIKKLETF